MKPKHNFGKEDLTEVLLTLWTNKADLIFIHERNRVQFTFISMSIAGLEQGLALFHWRSPL
jgi:hypothetical protein